MRALKINIIHVFFFLICISNINAQDYKTTKPKNIIIMIADGMGFNHLKATELYLFGLSDSCLLRSNGFVKLAQATYPALEATNSDEIFTRGYNAEAIHKNPLSLNKGFTDSGAAATAIATGKKTYNGAIGIGVDKDTLVNLVELAKSLGKAAGLVISVPISHATPAGFVAHNSNRNNYKEIARQMILDSQLDVLMGCGNPDYNKNGEPEKMNAKYIGGDEMWKQLKSATPLTSFLINDTIYNLSDINNDNIPDAWTLIQDSSDFAQLTKGITALRILGLPKVYTTLQQERNLQEAERNPFKTDNIKSLPTLKLMTTGALNALNTNKKGFFLMVEGGAIDWASHDNQPDRMIEEMVDFLNTVETVVNWINNNSNWQETLLIVTADHECGFLWSDKGNDKYYPLSANDKGDVPKIKFYSNDHTNSLVPFFAKGSGSNLFKTFADEYDPNYGYYIQNSVIAQAIFLLWGKNR